MDAGKMNVGALAIPPGARADAESVEVLRAWIADEGLHVSLLQAFPDPETWGLLLVDVARHAARAFANEKLCAEDEALQRIRSILDAEWDAPTDVGTTEALKPQ